MDDLWMIYGGVRMPTFKNEVVDGLLNHGRQELARTPVVVALNRICGGIHGARSPPQARARHRRPVTAADEVGRVAEHRIVEGLILGAHVRDLWMIYG